MSAVLVTLAAFSGGAAQARPAGDAEAGGTAASGSGIVPAFTMGMAGGDLVEVQGEDVRGSTGDGDSTDRDASGDRKACLFSADPLF